MFFSHFVAEELFNFKLKDMVIGIYLPFRCFILLYDFKQ